MDYFLEKLDNLLNINNISKNKLAKELDISESTIRSWYKGSVPALDKVVKIAKYFEVSVDYLSGLDCDVNGYSSKHFNKNNYIKNYHDFIEYISFTPEELSIIKKYRMLNDKKKSAFKILLEVDVNEDSKTI